ncbi:hypothetical protein FISHEDRAFT_32681 [Fistulina hepatica ATCC 64428]|uniref:Uncharacterized protein n=1 Tax=Fistulina hepatica ATCC 64428 TaxID=1128425 RepID=A0A0D7AQI9_9AGAR|nr:hypothetical protein FISHEDRAFT_32681 [Fistulina hepatica ATCC 64428]
MEGQEEDFSMSKLSLHSNHSEGSATEDWDRSMDLSTSSEPLSPTAFKTPRNSVHILDDDNKTPSRPKNGGGKTREKRSLSELLKLHAEEGTACNFTHEETMRLAEVLGQWINASSSPYEDDDDFFANRQREGSLPPQQPQGDAQDATKS